jgi:glyoxylase-like metal-dependent hydrolase (beta-lactamase superfamily II)
MSRVKLQVLEAGSCVHPEHVVLQNRRLTPLRFPALYAVIEHSREGLCLFDTGYSSHFVEATRPFPERLYAWVTPVSIPPDQTAVRQLASLGYAASDVRQIFISHFHADHISALRDFPRARFRFLPSAWEAVRSLGRFEALRRGVLPALLPDDFASRSQPVGETGLVALPRACAPFELGFDVFADGSCFAVELPGHARGQLGLVVRNQDDRLFFLVADACWTRAGFVNEVRPHPVTALLFDDTRQYHATLGRLAELHRREAGVVIVPSHCQATFEGLRGPGASAWNSHVRVNP